MGKIIIMLYLQIVFLGSISFIPWKKKNLNILSYSSYFNEWLKTNLKGKSKPFDLTMEENSLIMLYVIIFFNMEIFIRSHALEHRNKMVLLRENITI